MLIKLAHYTIMSCLVMVQPALFLSLSIIVHQSVRRKTKKVAHENDSMLVPSTHMQLNSAVVMIFMYHKQ